MESLLSAKQGGLTPDGGVSIIPIPLGGVAMYR
jgi:hypothetical protein